MIRWWRGLSVRVKLTCWYMTAVLIVLAVYAGSLLWVLQQSASRGLDERLRGDFKWAAEMAEQKPDGSLTWFETTDAADEDLPWLQVWSPSGELLFKTAAVDRIPIAESGTLAARAENTIEVIKARVPVRVLSGRSRVAGKPVVLQVARSEAVIRRTVNDLLVTLLLSLPVAVVFAGVGGYWLARHTLAPVDRVAERARTITAERFGDRLPIDNPNDEFGRLTAVINDMLERLEQSFAQMRRFTSDVSHELRTPLTAIRSVGEVALRTSHSDPGDRAAIGSMLEEVDRLGLLVDRLLTLSRAEMGQATLAVETIDLRDLAEQVVAHLGVLAEERQQILTVEPGGPSRCLGDRSVLRQALLNIVDNALKYTPAGGRITLRLGSSAGAATLDVVDTGPGMDAETSARVFDRFYRGAAADMERPAGMGIGLAIAKWAVEVNGGRIAVQPSPGGGSTFRLTLTAV